MRSFLKIAFILILSVSISACKKNQIGGKASFKGTVKHNDKPIENAYVYIKFNTSEFPGTDVKKYDTFVQADANGNFSITFYKGSYYLYATGLDLDIPFPFEVSGGLAVNLTAKESVTQNIAVK